jgi:hypothetical protein
MEAKKKRLEGTLVLTEGGLTFEGNLLERINKLFERYEILVQVNDETIKATNLADLLAVITLAPIKRKVATIGRGSDCEGEQNTRAGSGNNEQIVKFLDAIAGIEPG